MTFQRVLVALALAGVVAAGAAAGGRSTLQEQIEFKRETAIHAFDVNVPSGAEGARLSIRTRVEGGEVRWTLTDSEGGRRLTGSCKRGRARGDTGVIESPPPGLWLLEIALESATGDYYVDWRSE